MDKVSSGARWGALQVKASQRFVDKVPDGESVSWLVGRTMKQLAVCCDLFQLEFRSQRTPKLTYGGIWQAGGKAYGIWCMVGRFTNT